MSAGRIIVIGECMAELSGNDASGWRVGFGGDTLNTSVYLARLLGTDFTISYMTRLGGDPFGTRMLQAWAQEGLDLGLAEVVADRVTGLYAIATDANGERSFTYWRDRAPARELLSQPLNEALRAQIAGVDLLYFSGITLAILSDPGRSQLIDLAEGARAAGAMVAFDPNYRARLWKSASEAKEWCTRAFRAASIAFASTDELQTILCTDDHALQLRKLGEMVPEVVLRDGPGSIALLRDGQKKKVNITVVTHPRDTTGAGDSFNAGYLAGRLHGVDPVRSAKQGSKLAAEVIRHPGAIIPKSAMPVIRE